MKELRYIMGMPITVELVDSEASAENLEQVFEYFIYIDNKFSPYKIASEVNQMNRGEIQPAEYSQDLQTVLKLAEQTKQETDGFFDIMRDNICDPSGLVKGWAIQNAAGFLEKAGLKNFYIEAGGDIQTQGKNRSGQNWSIGIRHPFEHSKIADTVYLSGQGIATSGTYLRGQHVYNPKSRQPIVDIVSLTVIGPNVYEADRFATAALAMGREGINFIENLHGFEGFMIDSAGLGTKTSHWNNYTKIL